EALRDVGKYFSVNMMMCKESVRSRLESREQGITYTEFSYMILQAYDFAHLYKNEGVTVQCGGSDQYGNIVAGIDLIRRKLAVAFGLSALQDRENPDLSQLKTAMDIGRSNVVPAFGLTAPLVTKSDGGKFGKTETGAIWLTPERTSPYAYYQFWLNTSDADVGGYLRTFTLLDRDEIERLEAEVLTNPGRREAQRTLAREATTLLHGEAQAEAAEQASKVLFSGQIRDLPDEMLMEVFADVPSSEHPRSQLESGVGVVDVLVDVGLAKSKREAKEFLGNGSVRVNGDVVGLEARITRSDLLADSVVAIRRGKKKWHLMRWV
ncbi:MAG TPA: tyrosine--tRNA ligase, partial [Phycisphaerales bacterium]|nr:tyrosine--tRNA ligase [Phycisphaerales bacterium]